MQWKSSGAADILLHADSLKLEVTRSDFLAALRKVCPSLSRASDVTLDTGVPSTIEPFGQWLLVVIYHIL